MQDSRKYNVLLEPLVTEKSTAQRERRNQYVFRVAPEANKVEIKQAVQKIFNVSVDAVNTSVFHGKVKRVGRNAGQQSNWKKAVVTLKDGDSINVFEGV